MYFNRAGSKGAAPVAPNAPAPARKKGRNSKTGKPGEGTTGAGGAGGGTASSGSVARDDGTSADGGASSGSIARDAESESQAQALADEQKTKKDAETEKAEDGEKALKDVELEVVGGEPAWCGSEVRVKATGVKLAEGATPTGYLWVSGPEAKWLPLEECSMGADGAITGKVTIRDVHLANPSPTAVVKARVRADGLAADSEGSIKVQRVADFSNQAFTTTPSHPTPGFSDLTAIYVGSLADRELKLNLRVKFAPGVRRWAIHAAGDNSAAGYKWADRLATGWVVWNKTANKWDPYTGLVDDTTLREIVMVQKGGKWVASDAWWSEGPWPTQAGIPSYSVSSSEVAMSVRTTKEAWDNRYVVKRKGCKGGKDCCRWRVRVDMDLGTGVSSPHYEITYVGASGGAGRANVNNWYSEEEFLTNGSYGSGPTAVRPYVHAHEVGHMMGAYDEYVGGGVGPDNLIDSNSIMGSGELDNLGTNSKPYPRHQLDMGEFLKQLVQAKHSLAWEFDVKLASGS